MASSKQTILQSTFGSIFTVIGQKELEKTIGNNKNLVAVSGRVNNPSIVELKEGMTLRDVINEAGGMINKKPFKCAQLGFPFSTFVSKYKLDAPLDLEVFTKSMYKNIIVLSDDDCIIQFGKYYIEYLLGNMAEGLCPDYEDSRYEIERIWRIFDRISKGKANLRDIYLLRQLGSTLKERIKQDKNITLEIIENFYEEIEEHIEEHKCYAGECPQLTKLRITDKCIGCHACTRVCPVDCISGKIKEKHFIDTDRCTHCGQCTVVCPVSAITEGDNTFKFLRDLSTPGKIVIAQIAPAVRVTIGEAFGYEPGENLEKKLVAALKRLGVDYVFDTSWAADLTIMEEAAELQNRLERYFNGDDSVKLPLLTSCCPSWVKFIEQNYPDMLDVPSTAKSPMQMFATIAKDIWAKEKGYKRDIVTSVAIMPCVAKKYEASRPEFSRGDNYDTDYVITTRELIKILKQSNIDLKELEDEELDNPLSEYSGAGVIFGRTGGVIEAATRTALEKMTGKRIENIEFTSLRGWEGFRSCELNVEDINLKIGVAHGLKEAGKMLDKIRNGEEFYHAIEIMACNGGCIGGGGQPKPKKRKETIIKRGEGLNNIDSNLKIRRSHENESVLKIYEKYLDYPLSAKAHELIHTKYFPKLKKY
ncbi:[FeFe] hydrogenase, group A [Clostridium isatidis]|uniref:Hydrogenase n=1 Tax=Clostridium isatidis TaxID=182773 RepID=A0A343JAI0_9CLOT|nr:[FeFe] hydrogenase, group A [Clostridium isatidis]ASW42538.1 hydrogenase [Clostridium isatidis]